MTMTRSLGGWLAAALLAAPVRPALAADAGQAGPHENGRATRVIAGFYKKILGRAPDAAGFAYWVADRSDLRNMAASFAGSEELVGKHPDAAAWLEAAYRGLLGRRPDAAGRDYWLGRLKEGATRLEVALSLATSPECAGREKLPAGGACLLIARPEAALGGFEPAPAPAPAGLSFMTLRGANLHEAPAGPGPQELPALLRTASRLHLNTLRIRIPLDLVANGGVEAEQLAFDVMRLLKIAHNAGDRVLFVLEGYKGYDEACGDAVAFTDIREAAETVIGATRGYPSLLAFELQSEPLSDPRGCGHASVIQAVVEMYLLVRKANPLAPTTVGESFPEFQSTWNILSSFASPHLYYGSELRSGEQGLGDGEVASFRERLGAGLDRLIREVAPLPLIVGEFGFKAPEAVTLEDQARLYQASYDVFKRKDVGTMFWLLAHNEGPRAYSVVGSDGSSRPAAIVIKKTFAPAQPEGPTYNFVSDSKADCEASIRQRLGRPGLCTLGGGCGRACGKPDLDCPSANPRSYGACLDAEEARPAP